MDVNVEVGNLYAYSDHDLRVVFVKDNQVMLERWIERELRGYVVVTGPYMDGEKLAWLHGEHFYCRKHYPLNATPTEAFEKAMKYMRSTTHDSIEEEKE